MITRDQENAVGECQPLSPRQVELLDKLEAHFFAHGYRVGTMDRLAQELKCSKRALYELAASRKQLFVLIIDRWAKRVQNLGLAAEAKHADARNKLAAYLEPGVSETIDMTEAFLIDLQSLEPARLVLEQHQRARMAHLVEILDVGTQQGTFKKVHAVLVAGICLAGIEKINEPGFLRTAGLSFSEAFSELYDLLMTGLRPGLDATDASC